MYTHTVQWKECDKLVLKKYWMFYKLVAFICLYTHRGRLFFTWIFDFVEFDILPLKYQWHCDVIWNEFIKSVAIQHLIVQIVIYKLPLAHDFNFDKIIYICFGAQLVWKKDLKKIQFKIRWPKIYVHIHKMSKWTEINFRE